MSVAALTAIGASIGLTIAAAAHGNPAAVAHTLPPGLSVALSHVPSWTHAHAVLSQKVSSYAAGGTAGGSAGAVAGALGKKTATKAGLGAIRRK